MYVPGPTSSSSNLRSDLRSHTDREREEIKDRDRESNKNRDREGGRDGDGDKDLPMTWESLGIYDDSDLNEVSALYNYSLSICLSVSLYASLSLSLLICLPLCLSLSLSASISIPHSPYLPVPLPLSVPLCVDPSVLLFIYLLFCHILPVMSIINLLCSPSPQHLV